MFVRLFIQTASYEIAQNTVKEIILKLSPDITENKNIKIEPYWKIEGVMVAEINLEYDSIIKSSDLNNFLYSIADKWQFYIDSALSSDKMEGNNLKYGLVMIDVHFQ